MVREQSSGMTVPCQTAVACWPLRTSTTTTTTRGRLRLVHWVTPSAAMTVTGSVPCRVTIGRVAASSASACVIGCGWESSCVAAAAMASPQTTARRQVTATTTVTVTHLHVRNTVVGTLKQQQESPFTKTATLTGAGAE